MEKIDEFRNYINKAKAPDFDLKKDSYTKEFLDKIEQYHLTKVSTEIMYIYFGGPLLDGSAETYIKDNAERWLTERKISVNYMKPNGMQYTYFDKSSNYKGYTITDANRIVLHAGKKTQCR